MKLTLIITYLLSSIFATAQDKPEKDKPENRETETGKVIPVKNNDAEMLAAIKKAQATFVPQFVKMTTDEKLNSEISMALLKVKFTAPHKEGEKEVEPEHMWVSDVKFDGKVITGILASQAHDKRLPKITSTVRFSINRISDWLIVRNGYAEGAFSVRLLRSRMNEKKRAEHDSYYPFKFDKKPKVEQKK